MTATRPHCHAHMVNMWMPYDNLMLFDSEVDSAEERSLARLGSAMWQRWQGRRQHVSTWPLYFAARPEVNTGDRQENSTVSISFSKAEATPFGNHFCFHFRSGSLLHNIHCSHNRPLAKQANATSSNFLPHTRQTRFKYARSFLRPSSHRTRKQVCTQICTQILWCCLQCCVNTPFDHNVFHFLQAAFASTSASCVNGALWDDKTSFLVVGWFS